MVIIKNSQEIEIMRQGGRLLARILKIVINRAKAGVNTKELDSLAESLIIRAGGAPSFKGYNNFPTTLCTCLNTQLVHAPAIPARILQNGDILTIDIGMRYPAEKGLCTDMAVTVPIGRITPEVRKLLQVTEKALILGIRIIKPGRKTGDLGALIQSYVERQGFSVVRDLVGHGVGLMVHEDPRIPNYGRPGTGAEFKENMTIAVEPMVSAGHWAIKESTNDHVIEMADGSLCAHFEHTLLITKKGCEILTKV